MSLFDDSPLDASPLDTPGGSPSAPSYPGLLDAIQAYWSTLPFASTFDRSRLSYAEAEEGTGLPYATYLLVSEVPQFTAGETVVVAATVQFGLHAPTAGQARTLGRQLAGYFDPSDSLPLGAPLTVLTVPVMHCLPAGDLLVKAEGRGPGGKDCWLQTLDYEILFSRSRNTPA